MINLKQSVDAQVASQQATEGVALLGKSISYTIPGIGGNNSTTGQGTVSGVSLQGGQVMLQVGTQTVPLNQVLTVVASSASSSLSSASALPSTGALPATTPATGTTPSITPSAGTTPTSGTTPPITAPAGGYSPQATAGALSPGALPYMMPPAGMLPFVPFTGTLPFTPSMGTLPFTPSTGTLPSGSSG
jgi:hypothetical protein